LKRKGKVDLLPSVSIIIAARNEERRIEACLQNLEKIEYPDDRFEIILVDDNSGDATSGLIEAYRSRHLNWKLIRVTEKKPELAGKKNALVHGLAEAKGDLIFTTDADCLVPPGWLKGMVRYFEKDVSMVLGYSPLIPDKGACFKLLQFDNLFSAIVSAAPAALGYPFSSVGRNLAYRRSAYQQVGGYAQLKKFRSGDDLHLTERFRYMKNGRIEYNADPDTFVPTFVPASIKEIIHQQIRKNSKVFRTTPATILFFMFIFLYYLSIPLTPLLDPDGSMLWGAGLFLKLFLELFCLLQAVKIFRQASLRPYIPLMQMVYPFYIILFSLLGTFQKYSWKN
jgi:cellulose synthase/poly-beta-1,6-N-acetylglucosamine synthase-like glycosyltransferase